jgi:hypothetical protein
MQGAPAGRTPWGQPRHCLEPTTATSTVSAQTAVRGQQHAIVPSVPAAGQAVTDGCPGCGVLPQNPCAEALPVLETA